MRRCVLLVQFIYQIVDHWPPDLKHRHLLLRNHLGNVVSTLCNDFIKTLLHAILFIVDGIERPPNHRKSCGPHHILKHQKPPTMLIF